MAVAPPSAVADTDLGESGGFFYVMDSVTSSGEYSVTADCPSGTHVAGGGWDNTFALGSQPVDGPDANAALDDGWEIGAYQGSPFASDAYAVCTTQASEYVRGSQKDIPAGQTRTAKAKCPRGTRVISGGGVVQELAGSLSRLHSSIPFDGGDTDFFRDDGWSVTAPAVGGPSRLRAHAVCRDTRLRYVENPGTLPPNGGSSPITYCPATRHVVGIGLQSFGPADAGYISALKPIDSAVGPPNEDADLIPDDSGYGTATNSSGFEESIMSVATCLR